MNDSLFIIDDFDKTFFKEKIRQRKHTDFANRKPDLFTHPDITKFKKVYKRHNNYFKKSEKYPLELIHIKKPKIRIDGKFGSYTKYYISIIQKLFGISDTQSVKKLMKFDGDVYKTIVFG